MDETVVNGYAPLEDLQHYPTLRSDISTQSLAPGDNKIDVALPSDVKPAALVPIPNFHGKEHHDVLVFDKLEVCTGAHLLAVVISHPLATSPRPENYWTR